VRSWNDNSRRYFCSDVEGGSYVRLELLAHRLTNPGIKRKKGIGTWTTNGLPMTSRSSPRFRFRDEDGGANMILARCCDLEGGINTREWVALVTCLTGKGWPGQPGNRVTYHVSTERGLGLSVVAYTSWHTIAVAIPIATSSPSSRTLILIAMVQGASLRCCPNQTLLTLSRSSPNRRL
jgi:hypothetical protein